MRERGPDVPHLGDIEHNLRAVRGDGLNDPGQSAGGKSVSVKVAACLRNCARTRSSWLGTLIKET